MLNPPLSKYFLYVLQLFLSNTSQKIQIQFRFKLQFQNTLLILGEIALNIWTLYNEVDSVVSKPVMF